MNEMQTDEVGRKLVYSCEFESDLRFREICEKIHEMTGFALGDGFRGKFSSHDEINYLDLYLLSETGVFDNKFERVVENLKKVFALESVWDINTGESRSEVSKELDNIIDFDFQDKDDYYVYHFNPEDITSIDFKKEKLESKDYISSISFLEKGASDWSEYSVLVKLTKKVSKAIYDNLDTFIEIELDPDDVAFELSQQFKSSPGLIKFMWFQKDPGNSIKMVFQDQYHYYYVDVEKKTLKKYATREVRQISKEDQATLQQYNIF